MDQGNVLRATVVRVLCISGTVLACCVSAARSEIPEDELEELVERIRPSIVRVNVRHRSDGCWYYGSGFYLNGSGDVITNHHVAHDADHMSIQVRDGRSFPVLRVLAEDEEADLALLTTSAPPQLICPLELCSELPSVGQGVILVGSTSVEEPEVLTGVVTAVHRIPGMAAHVGVKASAGPGWSGSPVLNTKGQLVGVLVSGQDGDDSWFHAVPTDEVSRVQALAGLDFFGAEERPLDTSISTARDLYVGARLCNMNGDPRTACDYYRLAIERDPECYWAYVMASGTYTRLGEFENAAEMLEKATLLDPANPLLYSNLAEQYEKMGMVEEAIDCYQLVLRLNPGDLSARLSLGVAYHILEAYGAASAMFKEGIRRSPDDPFFYIALALVHEELREFEEAIPLLRNAIVRDPGFAMSYSCLGDVFADQGSIVEAIVEYEEATCLEPMNGQIHSDLGKCYLTLGDLWHAAEKYWILMNLGEEDTEALADEVLDGLTEPSSD